MAKVDQTGVLMENGDEVNAPIYIRSKNAIASIGEARIVKQRDMFHAGFTLPIKDFSGVSGPFCYDFAVVCGDIGQRMTIGTVEFERVGNSFEGAVTFSPTIELDFAFHHARSFINI